MRNPVRRIKEILGELLLNGQQVNSLALRQGERLDGLDAAVHGLDAAVRALAADVVHTREEISKIHDQLQRDLPSLIDRLAAHEQVYFGLNDLDRALEAYLDLDGGYFVELGANDGVAQSNTLHFERFRGWSGLLVEPTPHNFLKCLANRAARTKIFCCACTSFDYRERFVEIAFSNLMSAPIGLDSDIADPLAHAEVGRQFLPPSERVFSFGALARPLNDLLVEAGSPATIDLLSLDVEGAEVEVLKGIDHDRFRFRYMCVECRDLDRLAIYLKAQGYDLVTPLTAHDYLFRDVRPG